MQDRQKLFFKLELSIGLLLIAAFLGIYAQNTKPLIDLTMFNDTECLRDYNIQEREQGLFRQGLYTQLDNDNFKCYLHCCLKKMAVLDDYGYNPWMRTLSYTTDQDITPYAHERPILPFIRICSSISDSNVCNLAFRFTNCVHYKIPNFADYQ